MNDRESQHAVKGNGARHIVRGQRDSTDAHIPGANTVGAPAY
jgi:hypothetical protein